MTTSVPLACHCGLNSFSIPVPTSSLPLVSRGCHCDSCRYSTGSLSPLSVHLPSATADSFPLGSTLRAALDADGNKTTRWFCERCGAHMLMSVDTPSEEGGTGTTWCAIAGVVKRWEELVEVRSHIHVGDTVDGGGALLLSEIEGREIPLWTDGEGSARFVVPPPRTAPPSSDPLLVQCLCTKVTLHLARPSSTDTHLPSPTLSSGLAPTFDTPPAIPSASSDPSSRPWHLQELSHSPTTHYHASLCVCRTCRLTSGSPLFPWAYIPLDRLSLPTSPPTPLTPSSLASHLALKTYKSSEGVERHFCGTCGATAFYMDVKVRPLLADLAVGLIRCAEGARAEGSLEWRKTLSMVGYVGGEEEEMGKVLRAAEEGMKRVGTAERRV